MELMLHIILALIGFGISIFTLVKDYETITSLKKIIFKVLAGLYILVLFGTVISIVHSNRNKNTVEKRNKLLLSSVVSIDSALNNQLDTLNQIVKSSKVLINKFKAFEGRTLIALKERQEYLSNFEAMNKIIKEQSEVERLELEGKSPDVIVISEDIWWDFKDSLKTTLYVRFKNLGKRVASDFQYETFSIFIENKWSKFDHRVNKETEFSAFKLYPYTETGHFSTVSIKYYPDKAQLLKYESVIIVLNIKYQDLLTSQVIHDQLVFESRKLTKGFLKYDGFKKTELNKYLKENKTNMVIN